MALAVKNSLANAGDVGDVGSIPGLGRSPGEGNGNPLQYSCLENPMDGGAWQATVDGVTKELDMLERAHTHTHAHTRTSVRPCCDYIHHRPMNQPQESLLTRWVPCYNRIGESPEHPAFGQ